MQSFLTIFFVQVEIDGTQLEIIELEDHWKFQEP